jgi:glycosyltransferase involved in cell wall biosynthesis
MTEIKLSFILPCYNVEKYIAECLDSLYAQDIPETEYEVICVNDCSPDGMRDIIVAYQQKHPNLILIDHEINKKQGGARNTGLRAAQGEYIWFVDPDDYIKTTEFAKMLKVCEDEMLDIFQFNYEKVSINGEFLFLKNNVPDSMVITGIEFTKNILGVSFLNNYDLSVCSRLHKTEYLRNNSIFFIENTIFEDLEFSLRSLLLSKRIKSVPDTFYCYRENPVSTMNVLATRIKGNDIFQVSIVIGQGISKLAQEIKNLDLDVSNQLNNSAIWRVNQFTKPLLKARYVEKIKFFALIKENKLILNELYSYFNQINKIIVKFPFISKSILTVFNPFVQFILKIKKWKG